MADHGEAKKRVAARDDAADASRSFRARRLGATKAKTKNAKQSMGVANTRNSAKNPTTSRSDS